MPAAAVYIYIYNIIYLYIIYDRPFDTGSKAAAFAAAAAGAADN